MNRNTLTQQILLELIHYDPATGIFTWKARSRQWFKKDRDFKMWNTRYSGQVAGGFSCDGYQVIGILGVSYRAHRLAFMYMTGAFPPADTDHIKGICSDNRWEEIRAVTTAENGQNQAIPKNNTSRRIGVGWHKAANKWCSRICVVGKRIPLGCFEDFEDAVAARKAAEVKYGYHPNHGRLRASI